MVGEILNHVLKVILRGHTTFPKMTMVILIQTFMLYEAINLRYISISFQANVLFQAFCFLCMSLTSCVKAQNWNRGTKVDFFMTCLGTCNRGSHRAELEA